MSDINNLITSLENAPEGSRELDEAIQSAMLELSDWPTIPDLPYSRSLDAALTLAQPGERKLMLLGAISWCIDREGFERNDWIEYLARAFVIGALRARGET